MVYRIGSRYARHLIEVKTLSKFLSRRFLIRPSGKGDVAITALGLAQDVDSSGVEFDMDLTRNDLSELGHFVPIDLAFACEPE